MNLPLNQIIHGDCLEVMKQLPSNSIDMILCDLPYGTTACRWDIVIPFESLWKEYKRIIKDNGAIVLTANQPFTSTLITSNLDMFKYCWIWNKNTGTGITSTKYQPMKYYEDIVVFCKSKTKFFPQMIRRTEKSEKRLKYKLITGGKSEHLNLNKALVKRNPNEKFPSNVININTEPNSLGKLHPTQKPVKLFEYLIKTYSIEGDIILDNASGSCTTAVACENLKRKWICIEKEEQYVKIGRERLDSLTKQLF